MSDFDELLDKLDKSPPRGKRPGVYIKRPGVHIREIDFSHIVLPLIDKEPDPWFAPAALRRDRKSKWTAKDFIDD